MKKLVVNLETCGRTGMCHFQYPKLFEERDDGFPRVIAPDIEDLGSAELLDVVDCCPTGSIKLVEESGKP